MFKKLWCLLVERVFKPLWCLLAGHSYTVLQKYSPELRRVGCSRCKRSWGMDDATESLVPWDDELAEACNLIKQR